MDHLVDTCFLIDLWREQRSPGPVTAFSTALAESSIGINWVVAGEFIGGGLLAEHDPELLDRVLSRYQRIHSDEPTVAAYASLYTHCRKSKRMIAQPDLWIAASALRHHVPLITRNARDFEGLPEVVLMDYSSAHR